MLKQANVDKINRAFEQYFLCCQIFFAVFFQLHFSTEIHESKPVIDHKQIICNMYLLNLFRRLRLSRSTLLASLIILSLIGFLLVFSSQMFTQDQFSHLENSIYHRKVNNDDETRSELNQRTLTLNPQMTFKKSTCRTSRFAKQIFTFTMNF